MRGAIAAAICVALGAAGAAAQERDWSKVEIKTAQLAPGVWMLEGRRAATSASRPGRMASS